MNHLIKLAKTTLSVTPYRSYASLRCVFVLIALACSGLSPQAQALCQEGCDDSLANTFIGHSALANNTTGSSNTASGFFALYSNDTGAGNTASGDKALFYNSTGSSNTATGLFALSRNTTGDDNTATGVNALLSNTDGVENTAHGAGALQQNTAGNFNTASGFEALFSNAASNNTATGYQALFSNTTGTDNTANGLQALKLNKTGNFNTATGYQALFSNTTGGENTADGLGALGSNTTGRNNIALGDSAGFNLTTGSNNIVIGAGLLGVAGESNTTRIGKSTQAKTLIGGIYGKTVASGTKVGVMIDSTGKLGTVVSSARFKEAIKPMDKTSEVILALKPVTFRYKEELDPDKIPQFGLVAEEVEKVNPDLVVRDEDGKAMSVRYEAINPMLLNEFLKEHRKVAELEKQIKALTAAVQKVSDQQQLSKAAIQVTAND